MTIEDKLLTLLYISKQNISKFKLLIRLNILNYIQSFVGGLCKRDFVQQKNCTQFSMNFRNTGRSPKFSVYNSKATIILNLNAMFLENSK